MGTCLRYGVVCNSLKECMLLRDMYASYVKYANDDTTVTKTAYTISIPERKVSMGVDRGFWLVPGLHMILVPRDRPDLKRKLQSVDESHIINSEQFRQLIAMLLQRGI